MITIKDIADMLEISTTTVSNVIHGKTSEVSQKTVDKVKDILEKYDYVPNINARNLAQNQSKIIGVAMKSRKDKYENMIADPFFGELLGAIEKEVRLRGYFLMMYISDNINEVLQYVSTWNADGLILVGILHDDCIRVKQKYKKPIILIDSYSPKDISNYVNIGLEDVKGSYEMTKYLIENGHTKIAFLADNMEGVDYERYHGYKKAMEEANLLVTEENLIIIRPGEEERESSYREIYEVSKNFTVFICSSDYYAATLMNYMADHGVKIPEELSFTGFDNNAISRIVRPALTTVEQDVTLKGELAVEKLVDMINGILPEDSNIILPIKLIIRDSVKKLN